MLRELLSRVWSDQTLVVAACFPLSLVCSVALPVALWALSAAIPLRHSAGAASDYGAVDVILSYLFLLSMSPAVATYLAECGMAGVQCSLKWTTLDLAWGFSLGIQVLLWYIVTCALVLFIRNVLRLPRQVAEAQSSTRGPRIVEVPLSEVCVASLPLSLMHSVVAPIGLGVTLLASSAVHGQAGSEFVFPVEPDQLTLLCLLLVFMWPGCLAFALSTSLVGLEPSTGTDVLEAAFCLSAAIQVVVWYLLTCVAMRCLAGWLRHIGGSRHSGAGSAVGD